MFRIKKTSMILIVFVGLIFAQQPKSLRQVVRDWPADYDETGVHWFTYDLADPGGRVNNETSNNCFTTHVPALDLIFWTSEMANFGSSPSWAPGDSIVAIGSWDSAYVSNPGGYGDNPNHCGFYWLFSDTLTSADPQDWQPDDTLRPLPQPIAALVGTNIEITIANPDETRRVDQNKYDVLGYWIWADTTGSGTPSKFDKEVGFVSVDGGAGDTTAYLHPIAGNYVDGQTLYWTYHLVATPDTGGSTCPGYSTYYLSRNSNPIIIIGIEETPSTAPLNRIMETYPNPFRNKATISLNTGAITENAHLKIFDVTGHLIRTYTLSPSSSSSITWDCFDRMGNKVPVGVYFVKLEATGHAIIEKNVKVE